MAIDAYSLQQIIMFAEETIHLSQNIPFIIITIIIVIIFAFSIIFFSHNGRIGV